MQFEQSNRLKELATDSTDFYLSCKSSATSLGLPYPGQYADYIKSALASGELTGDVEQVALAVLEMDSASQPTTTNESIEAARKALDELPIRSDVEIIMRIIDPAGLLAGLPLGSFR